MAQVTVTPAPSCSMPVTRCPQRTSISGCGGDPLVEQLLGLALRDVHERRERGAATVGELVAEQLVVAVEGAGRGPGDAAAGDLGADADGVPDVEDVALLADRLAADQVALGAAVEDDDAQAPAGEQQRGRLADRAAAQHEHRGLEGGMVIVRVSPAARPTPARSRSAVQMTGRSMPPNSSQRRCTSKGRQCSKIGQLPYLGASAAWVAAKASLRRAAGAVGVADGALHGEQEVAGLLDGGVDLVPAAGDRAPATDQLLSAEGLDPVEGVGRPVEVERVAGVQRRLGLDQVAGEEDLVLGEPGDDVALGVPAAEELQHQLAPVTAELDGELVAEGHGRPGEAGDGLGLLEQPRHPAVLALPVLLAALGDEVLGLLGADDDLGVERAGAEHADGVVVAEHQVADRLVGVLAQLGQPPAGRDGSGQASKQTRKSSPSMAPRLGSPSAVSAYTPSARTSRVCSLTPRSAEEAKDLAAMRAPGGCVL